VSLALASAKLPNLLARASRAALNVLWLGALSDEGLRALDERYYDRADLYRSAAWNERGLFDWERRMVEEHFTSGARVGVAACGGGREVLALLEAGFDAVGHEPHPGLAAYAAEFLGSRGHPDRVGASPRDGMPDGAGPYDALIVGWGAYSLMHGRERRIGFLRSARRVLPAGAPMLVSFFERQADTRELRWTRAGANGLRRLLGRSPLELGDTLAPNLVHVFTRAEFDRELAAAGFALAAHERVQEVDGATEYASAIVRAA
jgi:hypothetical protein